MDLAKVEFLHYRFQWRHSKCELLGLVRKGFDKSFLWAFVRRVWFLKQQTLPY